MTDRYGYIGIETLLNFCENTKDHAITPYQTMRSAMDHLQRILRGMPSAQPERIRGRWEIYVISMLDGEGCKCSECGFEGVPYWDFCPNCGADMRETDGSED